MKDYDFRALNDMEFERLAIDLLSKKEGILIERFKSGRDGGVDGRFYQSSSETVIIQAKHYVNTGYNGLFNKLKNEELVKVKKLNPDRYIFITSVGLSPENKNSIKQLFHPYIHCTTDIYGQEGINDLISSYPDIEKKYYKLWLPNTNILIDILNNGAIQKGIDLIENAKKESAMYIETKQFKQSIDILHINHAVILTGLPGVGKTTLAKQLALFYYTKGYEAYHIEGSISEIESAYVKERKQIYYFDDFLGANYLEILSGNSDSKIVNFIKRIINDKNKKIILTSRTNILNRAKNISETFNLEHIEQKEFEISVTALSDIEKADILYNHLWHSLLPEDFSDVFYENNNYWRVIQHKNFNPRLISIITDKKRIAGIKQSNYWTYIKNSLDNPEVIWDHFFKNQIPDEILDLVNIVVFNNGSIEERECINALKRVFERKYKSDYFIKINKIEDFIKESLKATLNRNIHQYGNTILTKLTPFNPSISDYIINRFSRNHDTLSLYFICLNTLESINALFSLQKNNKISFDIFEAILVSILNDIRDKQLDDYAVHLYHMILNSNITTKTKKSFVFPQFFLNINEDIVSYDSEIGECVLWAIKNSPYLFSEQYVIDFIEYAIRSSKQYMLRHEDFIPLTTIIKIFPDIEEEEIIYKLKDSIKEYWRESFDEKLADSGKIQNLDDDDRFRADDIAFDMLRDIVQEYDIEFEDNDLEYMFENVDASTHLSDHSYYRDDDDDRHAYVDQKKEFNDSADYINDLFKKH